MNRTSDVLMTSLAVTQREGQRHTAEFVVEVASAGSLPSPGQPVSIDCTPGPEVEFGGIIQTVERQEVRDGRATTFGSPAYKFRAKCFCSDFKLLTDRRLAGSREFVNEFASNIARTLLTLEATDGVIIDDITPNQGPEIKSFKIDYPTVTKALDQLLTLCPPDWRWEIGYNRRARFGVIDTAVVDWTIGADNYDVAFNGLSITYDNTARANKIVAVFDRYESDEQVETYGPGSAQPPDGTRREWEMAKPLARVPAVTLNGATQTVGVRDLDISAQWWWSQDSNIIQRNPAISPPAGGQTVEFRYVGFDRIEAFAQDNADISATAIIEGTSGVYEELVTVSAAVPRGDADQIVEAVLAAKKAQGATLRARQSGQTNNWRPRPSDTIRVNGRAGYPNQTFIVRSVTTTVQPAKDMDYRIFLRTIEAVAGSTVMDGLTFFSAASGAASGTGSALTGGFVFGGGTAVGETPWVTATPAGATHNVDHSTGDRHFLNITRDLAITVSNLQDGRKLRIKGQIDGTQRAVNLSALPMPSINATVDGAPNSLFHWDGEVIGGVLYWSRFDPGQ